MKVSHLPLFASAADQANSIPPAALFDLLTDEVPHLKYVARCRSLQEDRAGTDYLAYRRNGLRALRIDLKEVAYCPGKNDAILLETARRGEACRPGWATDDAKETDLIVIVRGDGSHVVLSSRRLREVLRRHGRAWSQRYRTGTNATKGYYEIFHADYLLVPRAILEDALDQVASEWRQKAA